MTTDWLKLIARSEEQANLVSSEMPAMVENDVITIDEASRFYDVVERGAQCCDKLIAMLKNAEVDMALIKAADSLEDQWSILSVTAGNNLRVLQGLPMIEAPLDDDT